MYWAPDSTKTRPGGAQKTLPSAWWNTVKSSYAGLGRHPPHCGRGAKRTPVARGAAAHSRTLLNLQRMTRTIVVRMCECGCGRGSTRVVHTRECSKLRERDRIPRARVAHRCRGCSVSRGSEGSGSVWTWACACVHVHVYGQLNTNTHSVTPVTVRLGRSANGSL
jgi:hypothetical protein